MLKLDKSALTVTAAEPSVRLHSVWSLLVVSVLLTHATIVLSPLGYAAGLRASVVYAATIYVAALIALLRRQKVSLWLLYGVAVYLALACITGIYWQSVRAALLPTFLCTSLLVAALATEAELRRVVTIGSTILVVLIVGGWIAFVIALLGIGPIVETQTAHGRPLYLYYTSLTPVVIGRFIRPSAIYDEPGMLSFVVCVFACMRHWLGMDRRITWSMLGLGFITFSLAHLVYVTVHFIAERSVIRAWLYGCLTVSVAVLLLSYAGIWDYFDGRLLSRLEASTDSSRVLAGDNRSEAFSRAIDTIGDGGAELLVFGLHVSCIEGSEFCREHYKSLSENPASPLAYYGLLVAAPYYLFIVFCFTWGLYRRSYWPLLGVGLLFLQRPHVLSAGYSILAALVLFVVLATSRR